MVDKMMNWAIFGAIFVVWSVGYNWVLENYTGGDHVTYMLVTVFTVAMMHGSTEGGNSFEHIIDGFKSCINGLIGWAVASVVYMVIYGFTMGDGFDMMMVVNHAISVVLAFMTTLMVASAFNGCQD